jgi:hypothetical protein
VYPADQEALMLASADKDLPTLDLAHKVSQTIVEVISQVSMPPDSEPPPRAQALWFMAILSFRSLRAAMLVVSAGYEDQAAGYVRVIDELFNRARKVYTDQSGEYARQWLDNKGPGKPAKLTDQDFWDWTSGPSHGTIQAIQDWLAVGGDDGSVAIAVGPERLDPRANATVTHLAYEVVGIGSLLAAEAGIDTSWAELLAVIDGFMDEYIPENKPDDPDIRQSAG